MASVPNSSTFYDLIWNDLVNCLSVIMELTHRDNIQTILLLLDFHKAFDTLDWSSIQHAQTLYNFGWITVFVVTLKVQW